MTYLGNFGFKAAIFDLDGTLFDSMPFWNGIDERFLKGKGIEEVPEDYLLAIAHLGAEETARYTKERFGLKESPEEMMKEWYDEALLFYKNDVEFKDGAYDYLKGLHDRGVKLAIATASQEDFFMPALIRLGADKFFSACATVNECGKIKEFPDVYELACRKLGVSVAETVVFEDIYTAVCGAKSGGFYTVGVSDSVSLRDEALIRAKADVFITSFTELI